MLKCHLFVIAWLIQSCTLQPNDRGRKRFCSYYAEFGFRCLKKCDQSFYISILEKSEQIRSEFALGHSATCENPNEKCCLQDIRTLNKCGQRNGKYGNTGEYEMLIIDDGEQENAATTGGEDDNSGLAEEGEWPHVCMVVEYENGRAEYRHAASLVGPNVLISGGNRYKVGVDAAQNLEKYRIRCGTWKREENPEESDYQEVEIEKVIEHPELNRENRHYDYAIILTKTKFTYTNSILPVCLPSQNKDLSYYKDCYAMGWGVKDLNSNEFSEILKSMKLQLLDRVTCQTSLKESKLSTYFELHQSFICGKIKGDHKICVGDGGGPLVCRDPISGRYVQLGIVSWGVSCGDQDKYPDSYSYLPPVVCWILKEINNYNQEYFSSFELYGENDLQKQICR